MKKFKFLAFASLATLSMGLASCSSSDDDVIDEPVSTTTTTSSLSDVKLSQSATFYCASDDYVLGEWESDYIKVCDYENASQEHWTSPAAVLYASGKPEKTAEADRQASDGDGEMVSQEEYDIVMAYLQAHPNEGSTEFNHYNYYIQFVGGAHHSYDTTLDQNGVAHVVSDATSQMDYIKILPEGSDSWYHFNDYNTAGGKRTLVLNKKITNALFHDSWGDTDNEHANQYRFYTIPVNGVNCLYLCFDYSTVKNSGETVSCDGIYDDYVIKIIPGCGTDEVINEDPTEPTKADTVTVEENVEVNFSLNADTASAQTKLSIHIRQATDVKVVIPVPDEYYIDKDDMFIVLQHEGEQYTYNELAQEVTYTFEINENVYTVTVTVEFNSDNITITTDGMNQEILDYLNKVYSDGLTVEVNNYFNTYLSRAELAALLDKTTIEFLDMSAAEVNYINTQNSTTKQVDENGMIVLYDTAGNVIEYYTIGGYSTVTEADGSTWEKAYYVTTLTDEELVALGAHEVYVANTDVDGLVLDRIVSVAE